MVAKSGPVDLGVDIEAEPVAAPAIDIVAAAQALGHVARCTWPAAA